MQPGNPQSTACAACLLHLQCPDFWTAAHSAEFWRESYCAKVLAAPGQNVTGNCASESPNTACGLSVPALGDLPSFLTDLVTGVCTALTPQAKEVEICQCLTQQATGEREQNLLAFYFNSLLSFVGDITTPAKPSTCSTAFYRPSLFAYVCPKSADAVCPCPRNDIASQWGPNAPTECYNFVNTVADQGACLPAMSSQLPGCQLQGCPCSN